MNEILFKTGLVLAIILFISSIFFFVYFKIPSVIKYLLKVNNKRRPNNIIKSQKQVYKKAKDDVAISVMENTSGTANLEGRDSNTTAILDMEQNDGTTILDMEEGDVTTILGFDNSMK